MRLRSVDSKLVEEPDDLGALLGSRAEMARSSQVMPQQVKRMAHSCGRIVDSIQDTTPLASLSGAAIAARMPASVTVPRQPAQYLRLQIHLPLALIGRLG